MKDVFAPKNILLLEDDHASATLSCRGIERSQCPAQVTWVKTIEDALRVLKRQGPHSDSPPMDLILCDINLGNEDGWNLLKAIRSDRKLRHLPVIMLTVSKDEHDVQMCYECRADGFINKPLTTEKFNSMLNSHENFCIDLEPMSLNDMPTDIWY